MKTSQRKPREHSTENAKIQNTIIIKMKTQKILKMKKQKKKQIKMTMSIQV